MIYIVLSVLASSLIFVIFKLFDRYQIDTVQAIIFNYITACSCGLLVSDTPIVISGYSEYPWFYGALGLGIIFISIFICMALTTQKNGLSVAAVASKMSVVIPVTFGILVYHESTGILKIVGIILALIAVFLTSIKNSSGNEIKKENIIYPALVFLGSGLIDTSLKYIEKNYVKEEEVALFSASIFGFAALTGVLYLMYLRTQQTIHFSWKNCLGGIGLGIPNYFSIYFLIQALRHPLLESSTIFTINNVAILLVSTLAGILFFKEKLILKNWIGILLSIISIILVSLSI